MKKWYSSSLLALASGFAAAAFLVLLFSAKPLTSLLSFFTSPFSSVYFFGSMLNTAGLLLFGSLGASIALLSGNINLGGEGQVYAGGLITALILHRFNSFLSPLAAIAAVTILCALLTLIPILLKIYRRTSELLTSFLFSASIIPLIDWAIANPLRDQTQNLLATPSILDRYRLRSLLTPSKFTVSFFIAVLLCLVLYFLIFKTRPGSLFRISGKANEFAVYAGLNTKKHNIIAMCASGSLHGLCGFFAVTGMYYTAHQGFYLGMGWNALSIALIAKRNPILLIPASLILSYIFTASDYAVLTNNFSFNMTSIIQAAVLLVISVSHIRRKK
ncbi:MAG: ABC transporter permease [Spirochaetaceae bacterium]|nr:ABC transporter permease [Spirochaetaceae bacterium]